MIVYAWVVMALVVLYGLIVLGTIKFHSKCEGYTIFKLFKFQIELWICPPHFECEMHRHPNIKGTLVFLKGSDTIISRIRLDNDVLEARTLRFPKYWFRRFYLAPNQYHGFKVGAKPLVFLNFQKWTTTPSSAAVDFQTLTN